ncbi:O-antigen ligase family protein [Bradyrhizobium sp. CAR08]
MTSSAPIDPQQKLLPRKVWPSPYRSSSSSVSFGLRHLVLCAAAVVLMFSNDDSNAVAFQALGVMLFVLSGAMFFVTGTDLTLEITPFDTVVLISVPVSYSAAALSQDSYSLMHTTLFLVTYLSAMIIARRTTAEELIMCIRISTIAVLALVAIVFGDTLIAGLMPGQLKRWELREAPFGMHPNLAGFNYGGFIVMAANSGLLKWRYNYLITTAIIGFCLAVMLVASARGGLLAVALTLAVYVSIEILRGQRSTIYLIIIGTAFIILSFFYWDSIVAYAFEMLDLDSKQRGLQSGGTGRFEIWARGIDYISNRSWEIFIGSGLRTAGNMGFPVESSYINLAVESGVFLTAAILISFLSVLARSYRKQGSGSSFHRFAFYTLLFAMFQSIFNRYLIAIGNPFSLMLLVIASKASIKGNQRYGATPENNFTGEHAAAKADAAINKELDTST